MYLSFLELTFRIYSVFCSASVSHNKTAENMFLRTSTLSTIYNTLTLFAFALSTDHFICVNIFRETVGILRVCPLNRPHRGPSSAPIAHCERWQTIASLVENLSVHSHIYLDMKLPYSAIRLVRGDLMVST